MKKIFLILVVFISGFLFSGNIFIWIDENGTRHYTNVAPPPHISVEQIKESNSIYEKISSDRNRDYAFKVLKVYDGDTIKVDGLGLIFKIRLAGIDAPEIGYKGRKSQPFSQKSKSHMERLVGNRLVQLKSYGIGGYNRQLAEVFVNGKNVNLEMIRTGLAEVYTGRRPETLDSKRYFAEESKARSNNTGMWVQKKSYQSPKQWRTQNLGR